MIRLLAFGEAVSGLSPVLHAVEFDEAYEKATRARLAFEKALAALRQHCAEHGCELNGTAHHD